MRRALLYSKTKYVKNFVQRDNIEYFVDYETLKDVRSKIFASNNGITVEDLDILNEDLNIKREMLGVSAENSDQKEMIKLIATMVVYMCLIKNTRGKICI